MVYLLLMDGFEEIEAIATLDILRRGGVQVQTAGIDGTKQTGAHGVAVEADISIDDADKDAMEMLILPGGGGHVNLDNSPKVHALIDCALEKGIYIAAICASPSILGKKGILKGHTATCYPGFEKYLEGAELSDKKAVVSGNIITANGPGSAVEFGYELLKILKGKDTADDILRAMQY